MPYFGAISAPLSTAGAARFQIRLHETEENLTGNEIRKMFLKFFEERGHRVVRSSSLVPTNDPTLLFTNAGMNQFKDVFLGLEQRDYKRATSCQKCVRAGGKHNDLENVGFTNRHHTFFEMLGNFSFGDYFKEEAIAYAWELVTSTKWYGIPLDKLYFTVFGGAEVAPATRFAVDSEAAAYWAKVGAPKDRIIRGPGPERKLLGHGRHRSLRPVQRNPLRHGPGCLRSGPRRLQIRLRLRPLRRNLEPRLHAVQSRRRDGRATLNPLPKPSVDTGMGLERLAAVLQGKISNFDTDLFMPLIQRGRGLRSRARRRRRGIRRSSLRCESSPTTRAPPRS